MTPPVSPSGRRPVVLPPRPLTTPQPDYFALAKSLHRQIAAIDAEIIRLQDVRLIFAGKLERVLKGEENV